MQWEKFKRKINKIKAVQAWQEHTLLSDKNYVRKRSRAFKNTLNKQLAEAKAFAESRHV